MKRNADALRRISAATKTAMRRRAEQTQCAACGRKNAMIRVRDADGFPVARVCRWCKHEVTPKA